MPAASPAPLQTPAHRRHSRVTLFPSDALTVPDPRQLTGRRVHLPVAGCTTTTGCGLARRINRLDGFDLDPRLELRFGRPVSLDAVVAATTLTQARGRAGERPIRIDRLVHDRATGTVYAHPRHQLAPGTTYRLRVRPVAGLPAASTTFTTLSATDGLLDLRRQLADRSAYRRAGIPERARGLRVDAVVPAAGTTFRYVQDQGSTGGMVEAEVPSLVRGRVVFGS